MAIFLASGSIALLADLIHNFGDAATAFPLGVAFLLRSARAERIAGLFVVAVTSTFTDRLAPEKEMPTDTLWGPPCFRDGTDDGSPLAPRL